MQKRIARILNEPNDVVWPDWAPVLNTIQQLGIVDEHGELRSAKLLRNIKSLPVPVLR
jgi:hypothetical protein